MKAISVVALLDAYRVIRLQQEQIGKLAMDSEALLNALFEKFPDFPGLFEGFRSVVEHGQSGQLYSATLHTLDETIQTLKDAATESS